MGAIKWKIAISTIGKVLKSTESLSNMMKFIKYYQWEVLLKV